MHRASIRILGFAAQAVSYALAGVFILFLLGEIFTPHSGPPTKLREWLGIGLITAACCAPVFGVRNELRAATVSLASLAVFCLLYDFSNWPVAAVLAAPGALHLLHALAGRSGPSIHAHG